MNDKKLLGKISEVYFGLGGYQECQIGLHLTFDMNGYGGCRDFAAWDPTLVKHDNNCKWSEESRDKQFAEIIRFVSKILSEAKVDRVEKLKGKPVEITVENGCIKDWRILTEVL